MEGMHKNDYIRDSHGVVREVVHYEGAVYHLIQNSFLNEWGPEQPWKFYPHYHEAMEIMAYRGDYAELLCDGKTYEVRNKEIMVVPPGSIHDVTFWTRDLFEWVTIQIDFKHISDLIGNKPLFVPQRINGEHVQEIYGLIKELYFYNSREEAYHSPAEKFQDLHILSRLLSLLLKQGSEEYLRPGAAIVSVQKIIDYCYDNFHKGINLDELSSVCHLSKYHMCRIFKKTTGLTITNYMNIIKVEEAGKMLRDQGKNITETCFDCGFSSVSYFIEIFKRNTGYTPKQWLSNVSGMTKVNHEEER